MLIQLWNRRTTEFDITIRDSFGTPIVIDTVGVSDNVRVKIGRGSEVPRLEIESNGSELSTATIKDQGTYPGRFTLRLHQDDVVASLHTGTWDIEVALVDDSEGEVIKHVETGTLTVHRAQQGDVNL